MARNNQRGGSTARRAPKDLGRRVKKKPCALCRDKVEWVDYKDVPMLRKYMSDRGKIRSRRVTGNCAQHQRALAQAIKTARELVLLPYTQRTVTERPGGRGGGRDRGDRGDRTLNDSVGGDGPSGGRGRRDAGTDSDTDADTSAVEVDVVVVEGVDELAAETDGIDATDEVDTNGSDGDES
jgi:small subunit ribosomal protein S18